MDKLWRVVYDPSTVFDEVRENCPILQPLGVVVVLGVIMSALTAGLFTSDQAYKERLMADVGSDQTAKIRVPSDHVEQTRETIENGAFVPEARRLAAIGKPLALASDLLWGFLVVSTYYFLAAKVVSAGRNWISWFGFACWCAVPALVGLLAEMVLTAAGSAYAQTVLSPLTWFGITDSWAMYLSIPVLWSFYLAVCGLQSWLNKGWATSVVVAVIPVAFIALVGFGRPSFISFS